MYFAYVKYPIFTQYDMENNRYGRKKSPLKVWFYDLLYRHWFSKHKKG